MPYGIPWSFDDTRSREGTAWSFRCGRCQLESFRYTPFCPECGHEHPKSSWAFGTTGRRLRRFWEPEEIREQFERWRGWTAGVGTFSISHAELNVPVYSEAGEWDLLYFGATDRTEVTPGWWKCRFELEMGQDSEGEFYTVTDRARDFRVVSRLASVYVLDGTRTDEE